MDTITQEPIILIEEWKAELNGLQFYLRHLKAQLERPYIISEKTRIEKLIIEMKEKIEHYSSLETFKL